MTHSILPPEVFSLPVQERVALVEQIWDSIAADESQFRLTDAQKEELDRRLARRDATGSAGADWGDVKHRILGQS